MKRRTPVPGSVWSGAHKWVTGILTTLAMTLTVLLNARNLGLSPWLGLLDPSIVDAAARRVVLTPRADTLRALGDTAVIVATVTDARGATLAGASLRWKSSDSTVASVDSTGTIIARAPGRATIEASVRDITSSAAVLVRQAPESIVVAGDSAVRLADGDSLRLAAHVVDARGHRVRGQEPRWQVADSQVAHVDSLGVLVARHAGRTFVTAASGELRRAVSVEVILTPAAMVVRAGGAQRALAGKAVPAPVVLQVVTRTEQPVPGTPVELTTENGEGKVTPALATTDAHGRVRVRWTLGPRAGAQRLFARVPSLDSAVTIHASADPAPRNAKVEVLTIEPAGLVGGPVGEPARVRVTDTLGVALAGVRLAWHALEGGTVEGAPHTDSAGYAEARWTLGRRAGEQRLRVQVGDARFTPATTLRARAAPGPAVGLRTVSGDKQAALVSRALAKPVIVLAHDSLGNAVAGVPVRATPIAGRVVDSVVTTGADGRATVGWTLGPKAGPQRLTLHLGPGSRRSPPAVAATITATARAAPAKTAPRKTAPAKAAPVGKGTRKAGTPAPE